MCALKNFTRLISLSVFSAGTFASAEEVYSIANGGEVRVLEVFQDCDDCPEMIVLPMGQFQMGSSRDEVSEAHNRFLETQNIDPDTTESWTNLFANETPRHDIMIDMPIAMGRNEITREEWAACVEGGGCAQGLADMPRSEWVRCFDAVNCVLTPDDRIRFRLPNGPRSTHARIPIVGITYHEMNDYTAWLNDTTGANVYRLPTEAEWEYAARAGTTTAFAQGDKLTLDQANFLVSRREIRDGEYEWEYDLGSAHEILPVDRLDAANGWGLRHMSANVSEFTSTCGYSPHRVLATSSQYLAVNSNRATCRRELKGGMYTGNVELARPARRVAISDDHWSPSLGFRVVRDLEHNLDMAK